MTYTDSKSKISTMPTPCIPSPVGGHQARGSSRSLAEQPTLNYSQAVLQTDTEPAVVSFRGGGGMEARRWRVLCSTTTMEEEEKHVPAVSRKKGI